MYRHFRYLSFAALATLLAGCIGDDPVAAPDDAPLPAEERERLRAALSEEMAERQQVRRYGDAWTVLAEAAEVAPGAIRLFYTRRIVPATDRASGPNQGEADFWNREHVWPQSFGLKGNPARTDLHNLVPADRTVNSARGNKAFDEATTPHHECRGCRVSRTAWEPDPEVQGDVARIAFYMDVRYEGAPGDEVPDLVLDDTTSSAAARFGELSTLARWHCADPISSEERQRHEVVANAQGNRNAFVDTPTLAEEVFGFSCRTIEAAAPLAAGRGLDLVR